MSIDQKILLGNLSDVIESNLDALLTEARNVRKELVPNELDHTDLGILRLYDNLILTINQVAESVRQIKESKTTFEQDPICGKVLFFDFSTRRVQK